MAKTFLLKYFLLILFSMFGSLLTGQSFPESKNQDTLLIQQWLLKAAQVTNQDSSFRLLENAFLLSQKIDYLTGKYQAAQKIADYYDRQKNLSAALRYNIEATEILKKIEDPKLIIPQLLKIGNIYDREKLHNNALTYYRQAMQLAFQHQLKAQTIEINELVGDAHSKDNQVDSAFIYYQKNVDFYSQQQQQQTTLIQAYQKIVTNFLRGKNYDQSLIYNLKIRDLVKQENNPQRLVIIYNNIGYNYNALKDYEKAITYFELIESIDQQGQYLPKSTLYKHLGIAHHNKKDLSEAISYFQKAEKALPISAKADKAHLNFLLASIFFNVGDIYNALRYNTIAENIASKKSYVHLLVDIYANGAAISQKLYDYETAFDYFKKSQLLRDSFQLEERIRQEQLLQQQSLLERAEKEINLLLINQDFQQLQINQLELEKEKLKLSSDNLTLESVKQKNELVLLKQEQDLKVTNLKNIELENQRAQQALELSQKNLETAQQKESIAKLERIEAEQKLSLAEKEAHEKEQEQQITLLARDKAINALTLERQASFQRTAYWVGGALSLILCMILAGLFYSRKVNRQLGAQKVMIEQEKSKSDALLLNILPTDTANELKETGAAVPKIYEEVSVLFTDFSGFTRISQDMTPANLLEELNTYFIAFDRICQRHNMEKIKTIGDAYMCVGGLPKANKTHAIDATNAAIEMLSFHQKVLQEKQAKGVPFWDMRLGIHTGSVVAGVVGENKFAYDIWGDTVNTASRMESSAEVGKINISDSTYHLVQNNFPCTYRGEISVKNRGKIAMYFVD